MVIIALDVGDKRIGIAKSDTLEITAQGLFTYNRVGSLRKDAAYITSLIDKYSAEKLVIGLPLSLDGSDSEQTLKVREFGQKVENMLRSTARAHIPVIYHDERYSSQLADEAMIEAGLSRKKRKDIIDKQAAVMILQSYLEEQ